MKILSLMMLSLLISSSCSSRKEKKENDTGSMFAERIFDIWKDIAKPKNDQKASEITVERPKLAKQQKMAVYFLPPEQEGVQWSWSRDDKDAVLDGLKESERTGRVFELINTSGESGDMQNMRYMAAQQGADTLLLIRGAGMVNSDLNTKALSYIVLVPMLFVDGNTVESTFSTQAVLWDVRKPFVHLGVETEGKWKMQRPLAFKQKSRAIEKSKEEAVKDLQLKLQDQLQQI